MQYTELHLHDWYSALDGLNSPAEYMVRAKELGMTHLAQTNHGTLIGHREFQKDAKEAGIVPILGVEAYISATDRFDRRSTAKRQDGTSAYNHIIILAQNETGLSTLNRLNEIAWIEGFYNKPRIDLDALEEHNEGLIVLSGCLNGLLCKAIEQGDLEKAQSLASQLKSMLGERFFIEIQGHNPEATNSALLHLTDTLKIRPVVTSDCHYARKEDLWIEEAMLILGTNPKARFKPDMSKMQKMDVLERFNYLYPDRRMTFQEIEIYLHSREDHEVALKKQGIDRTDVFDNTMEIANSIGTYPFHEGLDLLPRPKNGDPDDILDRKARAGLANLGLADKPEYVDRLNEELEIIKSKDFSTYFLIVANMITWARSQGIMVGPGRGSAAGSLVCYSLGITQVDPIEYGLLFFRFINPERNDFPDIDTDIEDRRRGEVKDYLRRQFKNVAEIATIGRFQGKNTVRAAGRIYKIPLSDVNRTLKAVDVPSDKPELFFEMWERSVAGKEFIKKYPEVLKLAKELTGRIASIGKHPAGLVLAKEALSNFVAIETANDPKNKAQGRVPMVALDMEEAADVGLIKLDALGLKALSVLSDTLAEVKRRDGLEINLNALGLQDPKIYKMLGEGYTKGIFQAEGYTFNKWILDNGVHEFNDLVIGTSIARPGPLNTVGVNFRKRRRGQEAITYDHEIMRKHTQETLGLIVYQEQVMQALTDLADMSMSEADRIRRIIGKKKDVSEFLPYKEAFIEGASKNISKALAEKLWSDFEKHAGYSFNKSHAVVYSLLTYWTAWCKVYYPVEFMYATLRNEDEKDVKTELLIEAKRLGVKVLLPHAERSQLEFSIEGEGLRFGLKDIKGIADITGNALIEHRPFGTYGNLARMASTDEKGNGITGAVLKSLNAVGAAAYDDHPKTGDERENFYEYLGIPAFETKDLPPKIKNQFTPLDDYTDKGTFMILAMVRKIVSKEGWSRVEVVDETGTAGIFHDEDTPIEAGRMYAILVSDNRVTRYVPIEEIQKKSEDTFVQFLYADGFPEITDGFYYVVSFQSRKTRANKRMAEMVVCDGFKDMQKVLVFPKEFVRAYSKCHEGQVTGMTFNQTDDGTWFLNNVE